MELERNNIRRLETAALVLTLLLLIILPMNNGTAAPRYVMPSEESLHVATWLQWPHHHRYGKSYRSALDTIWVNITKGLIDGERVHIIAYDEVEKARIEKLLNKANALVDNVHIYVQPNDDIWIRDNGPIFVLNEDGNTVITDWQFNAWGEKNMPFKLDNAIPHYIAKETNIERIHLDNIVLEGGSIEIDGEGTLMATRSSILEPGRNPTLDINGLEDALLRNLGVENFIWLDGRDGGKEDITDTHIDGFARFANSEAMVTMSRTDLTYWGLSTKDINTLYKASNANGKPYRVVTLPLTTQNVRTSRGKDTGFKGTYLNYYVANKVVLVPQFDDANDTKAVAIIESLYPDREVIGIDVRNLIVHGGALHCVTQQQPKALGTP